MNPKEKAKEIVNSFYQPLGHLSCNVSCNKMWEYAKTAAIGSVQNTLASFETFMDSRKEFRHELEIEAEKYWLAIQEEIGNL